MKNRLSVLYQNDTILALDKPAGLLSVPDRYKEDKPSLAQLVLGSYPSARPLHRLDFETSGIFKPDVLYIFDEDYEKKVKQAFYEGVDK